MVYSSYTVSGRQCRTTLSTFTLRSVGDSSLPCVVPMVALNCGPWSLFWRVTNSWCNQNSANNPCIFGPPPYPASFLSSHTLYRLLYALLRSRNTRNIGSWSTLANSCAILSSIIAVLAPLPEKNLCKTSWNCTTVLIQVSITASTTFHMTSSSPTITMRQELISNNTQSIFHGATQ